MQFKGPLNALVDVDYATKFDDWIVANQGGRKARYVGDKIIIPTLEGEMTASPQLDTHGNGVLRLATVSTRWRNYNHSNL